MNYVGIGFAPTVTGVVQETDLVTGEIRRTYEVDVEAIGSAGRRNAYVSSLHNVSWFEMFGYPDAHLSAEDKRELEYKMQCDAAKVVPEQRYLCRQGLQFCNGTVPIYVFGDKIFSQSPEFGKMCRIKQGYRLRERGKHDFQEEYVQNASKYFLLIPEVSPVIFYGALMGVLKPILTVLCKDVDFIIAVIGPKGHLKTSLVKLLGLWLDGDVQKVDFTSGIRKKEIEQRIISLAGQNFLLDDLHPVERNYDKSSMKGNLDFVTRYISNNACNTNVFVTGESIKDMAVVSTRDRTLQISVPRMDGIQLGRLKDSIGKLSGDFMAGLAMFFVKCLVENYSEVVKDIEIFLDGYEHPDYLDGSTRISDHIKYVKLTEFLYRKYLCAGKGNVSGQEYLEKALEKQAKIQQEELLAQEDENSIDYVIGIYNILNTEKRYIKMISQEALYDAQDTESCLIWAGRVYMTRNAMQNAVWNYYQRPIQIGMVVAALHNAGILEEDGSGAKTKKCKYGGRHYVISVRALQRYCDLISGRE